MPVTQGSGGEVFSLHYTELSKTILAKCMGFDDTFCVVVESLRDFLGDDYYSAILALRDPEAGEFYFLLEPDNPPFDYFRNKHKLTDDLTSYTLQSIDRVTLISDPVGYCKEQGIEFPSDPRSLCISPISVEGEKRGVILCRLQSAGVKEENPLFRFMTTLSEHISLILDKLYHYEVMRQELIEMQAVSQIGARMYGTKKPDDVLKEIIDNVIDKLGFDRVMICLVDPKTNHLVGRVTRGYEECMEMVNYDVSSSTDVLAEVARTGKSHIIQNIKNDPRIPEVLRERTDIWQCAYVPLISMEGMIWGTLSADHKINRGQITQRRLHVLEEFARHASMALDNARLYEHVEHMAEIDGLTQVYNRQYFERIMKKEIPRVKRYNEPLSLLMLDVCDFKKFNDRYGHVVGDQILRMVARLLMENVRESDVVARYGGDEFVVVMPNTSDAQARMVIDRMEHAVLVHNSNELDPRNRFRISIGLKSANALTVDNILTEADQAMYQGRKKVVKQSLLHALIANDAHEVERWDRFIANILKILSDKEPHFNSHSRRVMNYSVKICQLLGLDHHFLEIMSISALLHDIGKISISTDLLQKSSALTKEEYDVIKTHPRLGVDLLKGANYLKEVRDILYSHHERWDGVMDGPFPGYPEGKSGEAIPLGARILKVTDAYDAMTALRPYSKPRKPADAIRELQEGQGKSFDPRIVKIFIPYLRTITSSLSDSFPMIGTSHNV